MRASTRIFFAIENLKSTFRYYMSLIQLLPEIVASQVAAGEVVERPASVVKELVENSIDAGARKIESMIHRGGISLVRVTDDGCGMDRDDALLSLERHATSKIRTAADLAAIATLGFRGEALPSIASVSRFRLTTREPSAVAGTEIIVAGGRIETVRDGGEAPGTQVEVRSLFYNLPARRKFLRSENTEARNIEHQLHLQAIGHPQIAFAFVRDERIVFQLPPRRICAIAFVICTVRNSSRGLLGVEAAKGEDPNQRFDRAELGLSRQTRAQQLVFVNGRAIESPVLKCRAARGLSHRADEGPVSGHVSFSRARSGAVDVNVHPAKREVRFRDPTGVTGSRRGSVRQTLERRARAIGSEVSMHPPRRPQPPVFSSTDILVRLAGGFSGEHSSVERRTAANILE